MNKFKIWYIVSKIVYKRKLSNTKSICSHQESEMRIITKKRNLCSGDTEDENIWQKFTSDFKELT